MTKTTIRAILGASLAFSIIACGHKSSNAEADKSSSNPVATKKLPEVVVGKWRNVDRFSQVLEFTNTGTLTISGAFESRYKFLDDHRVQIERVGVVGDATPIFWTISGGGDTITVDAGGAGMVTKWMRQADTPAAKLYDSGDSKLADRDYGGAIADFTQAIASDPKFAAAYQRRAWAEQLKGDREAELADLNRAIDIDPTQLGPYAARAAARAAKGDTAGAIADYTHCIESDGTKFSGVYGSRAKLEQAKGDLDAAIADFDHVIGLNANDATAYVNRGNAKQAKGDLDGAIADYDHAIQLNANDFTSYLGRGSAKQARNDLDGAIADYDYAIKLNPRSAEAFSRRGNAKKAKGDMGGAIEDGSRAAELDPKLVNPYQDRVTKDPWTVADIAVGSYAADILSKLRPLYPEIQHSNVIAAPAWGMPVANYGTVAQYNWLPNLAMGPGGLNFNGNRGMDKPQDQIVVVNDFTDPTKVMAIFRTLKLPASQWPLLSVMEESLEKKYGKPSRITDPGSMERMFIWYSPDATDMQTDGGLSSCRGTAAGFFLYISSGGRNPISKFDNINNLKGGKFLIVIAECSNDFQTKQKVVTELSSEVVDFHRLQLSYRYKTDKYAEYLKGQEEKKSQVKPPSL